MIFLVPHITQISDRRAPLGGLSVYMFSRRSGFRSYWFQTSERIGLLSFELNPASRGDHSSRGPAPPPPQTGILCLLGQKRRVCHSSALSYLTAKLTKVQQK